MTCSIIEGRGILVLLEASEGRVRGQLRSTAAVDSSFEIGRFEVPWKVLAQVARNAALSFASPFGFVVMRRCGPVVEVCYGNDLGNEYGLAVLSVEEYRTLMNGLRTTRRSRGFKLVEPEHQVHETRTPQRKAKDRRSDG